MGTCGSGPHSDVPEPEEKQELKKVFTDCHSDQESDQSSASSEAAHRKALGH